MAALSAKFRSLIGDEAISVPDDFIVNAFNWCLNSLPSVPKLDRAFAKHYTLPLDANEHYSWKLETDFRFITDLIYLNFYTSEGGDPCPLPLCYQDNIKFYKENGLPSLKISGKPCAYTLEREDDDLILVFDRPSNVPIIADYIAYGIPKPVPGIYKLVVSAGPNGEQIVTKEDVPIEISGIIENLILSAMRRLYYMEASDFAFSGSVESYLDNKEVVEAVQMLNKRMKNEGFVILGEQ